MSGCIKLSEVNYDVPNDVNETFKKIYDENYMNPTSKRGYCNENQDFIKLGKKDKVTENIPSIITGIVVEPIINTLGITDSTIID